MGVEGELHEVLLVFPQTDFRSVDRRLDDDRCGVRFLPPITYIPYQFATRKAVEVLDDEVRETNREGRRPKGIELFLNPRNRLRRVVLPDEFVVEAKSGLGFVRAAQEGCPPSVRQGDYASLPVNQAEDFIRQYANRDLP